MKKIMTTFLMSCMLVFFASAQTDAEKIMNEENAKAFLKKTIIEYSFNDTLEILKKDTVQEIRIPAFKEFIPKNVFSDRIDEKPIASFSYGKDFEKFFTLPDKLSFQISLMVSVYQITEEVTDFPSSVFSKKTTFSIEEFYHILGYLIAQQSNGEAGILENDYHGNIFLVETNDGIVPVSVYREVIFHEWYINARLTKPWYKGSKVFFKE